MKAIILAAGYATRLYPLTLNSPKALLPVAGIPIIDYIVLQINTVDTIDEIVVVTNSKFATHFKEWVKNSPGKIPISILDDGTTSEDDRLGAIGDIQFTLSEKNIDDDVMIIAGDNFFTYSLVDYYKFFQERQSDCVVVKELDDIEMLKQFAVAQIDDQGRVVDLVEKPTQPKSNIAVYATYIYKRETLPLFETYLKEGNKPDAPGYFVQWLYTRKDVLAYKMDGDCYDIGTPQSYAEIQNIILE